MAAALTHKELISFLKREYTEPGVYAFAKGNILISFWAVNKSKIDLTSLRVVVR